MKTLFFQLNDVYNRKKIMVDYRLVLASNIAAFFSRSNGDPMIHLASEPFLANNIFAVAFPKGGPYSNRFNKYILRMLETGS